MGKQEIKRKIRKCVEPNVIHHINNLKMENQMITSIGKRIYKNIWQNLTVIPNLKLSKPGIKGNPQANEGDPWKTSS